MTGTERPTVPAELDQPEREALRELEDRDTATLHAAGRYLEALAAWKETQETTDDETGSTTTDAETTVFPEGVPDRARVSVTSIGGTEYYYYQWRDGDEIRSETVHR